MALRIGDRLGVYEIVAPLGSGGMGQVYRARDTKLGREAAIKVLRPELASDPERVRRFEQEARAASALNHPNIITIYDIVEKEGNRHIAMEYVDGSSLRELLAHGSLPIGHILGLAKQLGEGVAKAHAANIIHRDLKPENVMVTKDGYVKILDFGLAKLLPDPGQAGSEVVTRDRLETRQGVVVGTVQYMSPEQAKGDPVDFRSDQFSIGSILYEMATGTPAFERETSPQTQAAVIEDEPVPIAKLNPRVPGALRVIVERCLRKNPRERYASTTELVQELKQVPEEATIRPRRRVVTWAAVAVSAAVLAALGSNLDRWRTGPRPPAIESIAVLPLHNLSGDPEQEYFADGMTEALITDLAKIGALKVISRSSAMRYKGTETPLPEIARELDVDAVVEGSALRVGDRVRITAQLIDPGTAQALWAESYERDLRDVLELQGEVAREVAEAIHVRVAPEEAALLSRRRPVVPEAHEAFLRAQYFASQVPEGTAKAIEYYLLALEKDPEYAEAYAGLAIAHHVLGFFGFMEPGEAYARVKAHALKAIELDETLARAHVALADVANYYEWDWRSARTEYERAIELDPNDWEARRGYSDLLSRMGRVGEGLAQARRAWELDPLSVNSGSYLASAYYFSRDFDSAIDLCRKALEVEPESSVAYWILWLSLHKKGMLEEATAAYARYVYADVLSLSGLAQGRDALERAHAEGGYAAAMHLGAEELERQWEARGEPLTIALSYVHAGANDDAFRWLERAYDRREPALPQLLRAWADFDPIRSDPRFQDLLQRMKFPS